MYSKIKIRIKTIFGQESRRWVIEMPLETSLRDGRPFDGFYNTFYNLKK